MQETATALTLPGEERYAQVLGEPVRYFRAGSGPPVVLLHGLGEAALVWFRNIPPLSEAFTVYAPDLLGHGRSGRPPRPYGPQAAAAFVLGFLDALGVPSAHLVGNSLGGLLALLTALEHPDRVRSLVLEDSAGLGREVAGFLRGMVLPGIGEALARPSRKRLRRLLRILLYGPSTVPGPFLEGLYQERARPGNARVMLQLLRAGTSFRGVKGAYVFRDRLSSLTTPTLVLWGRQDPIFPVAHGLEAARRLSRGQVHIFEECGHWPHFERWEEFNRLVAEFFQEQEVRLALG